MIIERLNQRNRQSTLILCCFACLNILFFSGNIHAKESVAGSITGRVLSPSGETVDGVPGISLKLDGDPLPDPARTTSQAGGRFSFRDLIPGHYNLTVESPGFENHTSEIDLSEGAEVSYDVVLSATFEEEVTVTATRTARATEEVPAAVSVIGLDVISQTPMSNIREAIAGIPGTLIESKNSGYDARLIIRGSGLKARYGIREIMVLMDGIPITDPDSFTRLDFIDTHMVEKVEVVRGPNSTLWGINATGGTINIITKSPFDGNGGSARLDVGSHGTRHLQAGYTGDMGSKGAFNVNFSQRTSANDWREWNEFDTTQFTFKPSWIIGEDTVWDNHISYTEANFQLPGRLITGRNVDQWTPYMETGEVERTGEPWKHSGRYSEILFFGSRLVKQMGKVQLKPILFVNSWQHHHPVTARINDADTTVGGVDLQVDYSHGLGVLTGGITFRADNQSSTAYTYRDTLTTPGGRILSTLSDESGELMRVLDRKTTVYGIYAQESLRFGKGWLVDVGARVDRINFDVSGHEWIDYDWGEGSYIEGSGPIDTLKSYTAFSPRIGAVFNIDDTYYIYGNISTGVQTPTSDELTLNPDLELTEVLNHEVGLKLRFLGVTLDSAFYFTPVKNEVVQVIQPFGESAYVNAGETEKKGAELAVTWMPATGLAVGGSYSYTDYVFAEFSEPAFGRNVDRSGNTLPYVPTHHYSIFARYSHRSGLNLQATTRTWGEYWMDNANTEIYEGYDLVTDLTVGYEFGRFEAALLIQNVFGERFAVEAQRDLYGGKMYSPAAPRSFLGRLIYRF